MDREDMYKYESLKELNDLKLQIRNLRDSIDSINLHEKNKDSTRRFLTWILAVVAGAIFFILFSLYVRP